MIRVFSGPKRGQFSSLNPLIRTHFTQMEARTVIAIKAEDDNNEDNAKQATNVHLPGQIQDEAYEVRRSLPRNDDSFIGGLDILTIHQMIHEQQEHLPKTDSEAT